MIFITGINSFVGQVLEKSLIKKKIKYLGVDLNINNNHNKTILDIRDKKLVNIIPENSTIIHLAAISKDKDCNNNKILAFDVNVNGTINLLESAKIKKAKKIIFASTEWVYGNKIKKGENKESDNIIINNIDSVYALTKIIGEKILFNYSTLFKLIILRFGIIYGPRKQNWSAFESIFNNCINSNNVEIISKKISRRYVHVQDIVDGILLSIKYPSSGTFNLTGKEDITLEKLIKNSSKLLKKNINILEKNSNNFSIRKPSNLLAKNLLKWKPNKNLNQGLIELKKFFL
jgi:UDP-glucose 4-epimerase